MKQNFNPSPKTAWSLVKRTMATAAIIPGLAFSTFGFAFAPVAYALESGVCAPGTIETITLLSNDDTQTAGYTETNPTAAPASFEPALYDGTSFSDADITDSVPVTPPWVDPASESDLTDAEWISTNTSNSEGTATSDQWRLFRQTFELPAGAVIENADLFYTADNAAAVYLNGDATEIDSTNGDDVYGATPEEPYLTFSEVYDTSLDASALVAGENTIDFIVRNWSAQADTNPTGLIYKAVIDYCVDTDETPETSTVTIVKYIDGEMATSITANNASFPMSSAWTAANLNGGLPAVGTYPLNAGGNYQAETSEMTNGASYSTQEEMTGADVGATCEDSIKPFALEGYSIGSTLDEAEEADVTPTAAFASLQDDMFVIVHNTDCSEVEPPTPDEDIVVTINKFVGGAQANNTSAENAIFPMSATWNEIGEGGIGAGTSPYDLSPSNSYQTNTIVFNPGSDYSTNEVVTGPVVGASCAEDKPFALQGYKTGTTFAGAMAASMTLVAPAFTNLQQDQFVIVYNFDCDTIGGEVEPEDGALAVTSIDSVDTSATANGSFEDGWEYVFHITTPTSEENLQMKFSNWQKTGGGGTIPVANNMRISSAQANNGGATILLTAADTYSLPALVMVTDLNPAMVGRQVEVTVEVAVPAGTPDGSYTTNYGVQTNP